MQHALAQNFVRVIKYITPAIPIYIKLLGNQLWLFPNKKTSYLIPYEGKENNVLKIHTGSNQHLIVITRFYYSFVGFTTSQLFLNYPSQIIRIAIIAKRMACCVDPKRYEYYSLGVRILPLKFRSHTLVNKTMVESIDNTAAIYLITAFEQFCFVIVTPLDYLCQ